MADLEEMVARGSLSKLPFKPVVFERIAGALMGPRAAAAAVAAAPAPAAPKSGAEERAGAAPLSAGDGGEIAPPASADKTGQGEGAGGEQRARAGAEEAPPQAVPSSDHPAPVATGAKDEAPSGKTRAERTAMPAPPPLVDAVRYHCFLTHDWGTDEIEPGLERGGGGRGF